MSDRPTVVLVGTDGSYAGTADKLAAHRAPGALHLAFSVVLYRADGRVLLQQRAAHKYHFPSVWANACCSHPLPGEDLVASAERRVREELGLSCTLALAGHFSYRATCAQSGLVEHEFDHVAVGTVDVEPDPDPAEVAAITWADPVAVLAAGSGAPLPAGESVPSPLAPWLLPALRLAETLRVDRVG